jgi:hypothetical protein
LAADESHGWPHGWIPPTLQPNEPPSMLYIAANLNKQIWTNEAGLELCACRYTGMARTEQDLHANYLKPLSKMKLNHRIWANESEQVSANQTSKSEKEYKQQVSERLATISERKNMSLSKQMQTKTRKQTWNLSNN